MSTPVSEAVGTTTQIDNSAPTEESSAALPAGTAAPEFCLPTTPDQKISLKDLRGKPVILVFYPADWSPVCSDQLALYNEVLPEFQRFHAQLIGISVDGPWCHAAYIDHRKFHFRLLSDFEPKGEVSRQYRAYSQPNGVSERALFVINPAGIIHWSYVSPIGINPGADGILEALESLPQPQQTQRQRSKQ